MNCTNKQQETAECEKRGCTGCFYEEKTADGMFKELGYEFGVTQWGGLRLKKDDDNVFIFHLKDKTFYKTGEYDSMHDGVTMQELQAINKKVEELRMDIDKINETKKNIQFWENEVQKALKENNIMKATGCRVLANQLRKDIGEKINE